MVVYKHNAGGRQVIATINCILYSKKACIAQAIYMQYGINPALKPNDLCKSVMKLFGYV